MSTAAARVLWEIPLRLQWFSLTRGIGVPVVEVTTQLVVAVYHKRRNWTYTLACAREAVAAHNQPIKE